MNARQNKFEFTLEGRQVQEAVTGLFHTLLFYRSTGKYHYIEEGTHYNTGSIGFEDVTCDFIDFTYVRASSSELDKNLTRDVTGFSNALRSVEGSSTPQEGTIQLEFYQKKKPRWPFPVENIPWEIWIAKVNIINLLNEAERQKQRCEAGEELTQAIISVAQVMNRNEYVPPSAPSSEIDLVFDTSYSDIQPYLFKITYQTNLEPISPSLPSAFRKIFRDTFTY